MSEAPPRGNFIAGQNRGKPQGSRQPDFTGRMSIPGRDNEHGVALWVRKDKHQHPYFSGRMDPMPLTDNVAAQIDHLAEPNGTGEILEAGPNLTLEPYQVLLFHNRFKEPDAADSVDEAAKRARRPDFWGRLNPGDGTPVVAVSVWLGQDRWQHPLLTGATSYPQPGRDNEAATEIERPADGEQGARISKRRGRSHEGQEL